MASRSPGDAIVKLLFFAEYVRGSPITISHWASDLVRAFRNRGHEITLAIDGADDCDIFAGDDRIRVLVHNPQRDHLGANPFAFQQWAFALRERIPHDRTVSLTPLVPGELWLPLGPGAWDNVKAVLATQSPLSALSELAHQPWLLAVEAAERIAASSTTPVLTFGSGPTGLGYASRLPQPSESEVMEMRSTMRELLRIPFDRPVVLISAFHAHRFGLKPFLSGFAHLCRETTDRKPLCLIIGRSGESIAEAASRAGCLDYVKMLGRTNRVIELLAAADLAAVPLAAARYSRFGLKTSTVTGRFTADALRIGRPVIALNRAPGAELLQPPEDNSDPLGPGWIVDSADSTQWSIGLTTAMSRPWLGHRTPAARTAGALLSMDRLIDRMEIILHAAAK